MWAFFSRRLRMWLLLAIALPLIQALVHRLALASRAPRSVYPDGEDPAAGRLRCRRRVPAGGPQANASAGTPSGGTLTGRLWRRAWPGRVAHLTTISPVFQGNPAQSL